MCDPVMELRRRCSQSNSALWPRDSHHRAVTEVRPSNGGFGTVNSEHRQNVAHNVCIVDRRGAKPSR